MWICQCGQETSRGRTSFGERGEPIGECCPGCKPEAFAEPFVAPSDTKIYSGPQAMPNMYRRGDDGTYHAKDELIADTVAGWEKGPSERALDHKRATRRTEPLSEEEIRKKKKWGNEVLAPFIQEEGMSAVVGALKGAVPNERSSTEPA